MRPTNRVYLAWIVWPLAAVIAILILQVRRLEAERDRLVASHRCFTYECRAQMEACGKAHAESH